MENVNRAVLWTKRLMRCIYNKGHSVTKSNKSKKWKAKKLAVLQKKKKKVPWCKRLIIRSTGKSQWQSLLTFTIVWQSWLQRNEPLAVFCGSMKKPGWLWEGQQGLMGAKDERVKEDSGVEKGSPFICLNSKNYKKIKSNRESSREDCKQGSLFLKGRCRGKKEEIRAGCFRDSTCLGSFSWPVTEAICIEPHS